MSGQEEIGHRERSKTRSAGCVWVLHFGQKRMYHEVVCKYLFRLKERKKERERVRERERERDCRDGKKMLI